MLPTAASTFQEISERSQGERRRRAAAGALALRALEQAGVGEGGSAFTRVRAIAEVSSLPTCAEKAILQRLLLALDTLGPEEPAAADCLASALVEYAYELETTQRLPEADVALSLALSLDSTNSEIALHAGRVARRMRQPERALELYRLARDLDRSGGLLARLAAVGEAAVSRDAERALGRVIREAVAADDAEAAAVALEERARVRRAAGRRRAAARDLCIAAMRFADPVDRARVAHELADLAVASGDNLAAREALLVALRLGDASQRDHARARLHTLSRDLGDQVGMRRWRSFKRPSLVSLSLSGMGAARRAEFSAASVLLRWREHLETEPASSY